ncbi:MAG TPA: hypothetical protein VMP68_24705 [Candidatus Eisenbacteria bacterium]|nr:hypothetical protein [Candidatus Eisenbacteria bacterium]
MNRGWHKLAILVLWLALPTSAWTYWHVWDQLPVRMAVHFDANWRANGFTSREGALQLGLGILVVMLVVFTVATLTILYLKPAAVWPALVISYVVVGFCWYGNYSIVKFNLNAQAAHSELVGTISPARSDSGQLVFQLHS